MRKSNNPKSQRSKSIVCKEKNIILVVIRLLQSTPPHRLVVKEKTQFQMDTGIVVMFYGFFLYVKIVNWIVSFRFAKILFLLAFSEFCSRSRPFFANIYACCVARCLRVRSAASLSNQRIKIA